MDDIVAEKRLRVRYPDGIVVPVCLRVGVPKPTRSDEAGCPVQAEGLRIWEGPKMMFGADTFQALLIAIRFVQKLLAMEVTRGAQLLHADEETPMTVEELFVLDPPG